MLRGNIEIKLNDEGDRWRPALRMESSLPRSRL